MFLKTKIYIKKIHLTQHGDVQEYFMKKERKNQLFEKISRFGKSLNSDELRKIRQIILFLI